MKHFFFLIAIAISAMAAGQPKIIINNVDEFTGKRQQLTSDFRAGDEFEVSLGKVDTQFVMFVHASSGCVGAVGNTITFLYDDGSTQQFSDMANRVSCSGTRFYTLYIPAEVTKKRIIKVRVSGTEGVQDFSVNPEIILSGWQLIE